nr:hypothetical protein [Desulfobacula sp.]
MQIDFHHAVTYVAARAAGFDHPEAEKTAYCAQYVDDAVKTGTIAFQNKALYDRICSAHKTLDYRNMEELANHRVWLPFHFLPGNAGKPAGSDPARHFVERVVCVKDSFVARDMIAACIGDRHKPYGLHRLGITLHTYADTWAHQGFAGIIHEINDIRDLKDESGAGLRPRDMLSRFFGKLFDQVAGKLVGNTLPLGHGAALCFPDLPYLRWSYQDSSGQTIPRDNTVDFLAAADAMCRVMKQYRAGTPGVLLTGLDAAYKGPMENLFRTVTDKEGEDRHAKWLEAIREGVFPFGPVELDYDPDGRKSWKSLALGTSKDAAEYPWDESFLTSDWKYFHDALLDHRFTLIHDILPNYNICAA